MALSTYAELKASILDWLKDSTITIAADFIALAEARFNRELRCPEMEERSRATASSGYTALPTDFLEMRSLYLSDSPDIPLDYFAPQHLKTVRANGSTGQPTAYTIVDEEILLAPAPGASYTLEMVYLAKIPALSDSNTSNWLLASHPDLYLAGALAAGEAFGWNDERIDLWASTAADIIASINAQGMTKRMGSAPLVARGLRAFS